MSLRLEDIEKIRQLKYRYWRSIDTGDIAALEELFTEDVRVDYIGGSYRWQMQGRDKIIESIAQSFHANAVACHTGHHPEIEVLTDTTATGTWYLTDVFINLAEKIRTDRQRALPGQIRPARPVAHRGVNLRAALRGSREVRKDAEPDRALPEARAATRRQGGLRR